MKYKDYRYYELSQKSAKAGIMFDVLVTGVTGAGKSTTLNTLFQKEVARVGRGVNPETMSLDSYTLNNAFRLWDTPGFGDGKKKDKEHSKKIINLLNKTYNENYGFIDFVFIIIEGSNRDMGTTYKLLNEVIVPNFPRDRIFVAINQADFAMKGRYWDYENNKPKPTLIKFLKEQELSIQKRVKESTGIEIIKPICYSAEYGYNINKLLDLFIDNIPSKKRIIKDDFSNIKKETSNENISKRDDKWDFYKNREGKWRWRRIAKDGTFIASSSKGFYYKEYCIENARRHGY